ncbi:DUF2164 domain-containing protein [Metabacillus sp. HB246100]
MFIKMPKDQKNVLIDEIQRFFYEERDEEIGEIAAESFLDFCFEHIGPSFYNAGVQDAMKIIQERNQQADDDLHALKRPLSR